MVINGVERLSCKTLVKDAAGDAAVPVTVEPLKSLPLQRDLMVDLSRFFEFYRVVKPFLINKTSPRRGEGKVPEPGRKGKIR